MYNYLEVSKNSSKVYVNVQVSRNVVQVSRNVVEVYQGE